MEGCSPYNRSSIPVQKMTQCCCCASPCPGIDSHFCILYTIFTMIDKGVTAMKKANPSPSGKPEISLKHNSPFRAIGATPYLCPGPVVLVGAADPQNGHRPNLVTVAWAGVCCSHPPMLSISLRKERYSYALIEKTKEFTVNLVSRPLTRAMDFCGVKSGRDMDKFAELRLTAIAAQGLDSAPALAESPAYMSCRLKQIVPLGSHDLFLADIVEVCVQEGFFTDTGAIDEGQMDLVSYVHGKYRALDRELGFFGYSVASEKALKRRMPPREG